MTINSEVMRPDTTPSAETFNDDGVLDAGPFKAMLRSEIADLMELHDVYASRLSDDITFRNCAAGPKIAARGQSVRSYFINASGSECSESDLEAFIIDAVPVNTRFVIQGRHILHNDDVVVSQKIAMHDGISVTWSSHRKRLSRHSAPVSLCADEPLIGRSFGVAAQEQSHGI